MDIENLNQASFKEYLDSCGVNENTMIFALNCFEYGRQSANKDKRKWVGLTDEEMEMVRKQAVDLFVQEIKKTEKDKNDPIKFGRLVEAKLKEKNT